MELKDRIRIILEEQNLKQKNFATAIKVSESYVSNLLSGKRNTVSESLASLVEEKYGYSSNWILTGQGEKNIDSNKNYVLSPLKRKVLSDVEGLSEIDAQAVLAFMNSLSQIKDDFEKNHSNK